MNVRKLVWSFTVYRDPVDRRIKSSDQPPYLTEEGLALVNRRVANERRELESETEFQDVGEFHFSREA